MTRNEAPSGPAVLSTVIIILTGMATLVLLPVAAAGLIGWWWILAPIGILLSMAVLGALFLLGWGLLMLSRGDIE